MKRIVLISLTAALSAFAADVTGNWKATAEGPNGSMERTFALKAEGEKLTGETVSSFAGKSTITEGKIKGDDLLFVITINIQGNEMKVNYKGKVINKDFQDYKKRRSLAQLADGLDHSRSRLICICPPPLRRGRS